MSSLKKERERENEELENLLMLMNLTQQGLLGCLHKIVLFSLNVELIIFSPVLCSSVELDITSIKKKPNLTKSQWLANRNICCSCLYALLGESLWHILWFSCGFLCPHLQCQTQQPLINILSLDLWECNTLNDCVSLLSMLYWYYSQFPALLCCQHCRAQCERMEWQEQTRSCSGRKLCSTLKHRINLVYLQSGKSQVANLRQSLKRTITQCSSP